MILCFQHKEKANKTYKMLEKKLKQLGLEFAEDKTRLKNLEGISENRKRNGKSTRYT